MSINTDPNQTSLNNPSTLPYSSTTPTNANLSSSNPTNVNNYTQSFDPSNASTTNALGQASIYSSAPAYNPVVDPNTATGVQNTMYGNISNPTVSSQATQNAIPIQSGPEDILGYQIANEGNATATTPGVAATTNPNSPQYQGTASTYNAVNATAAQGTVDPNSLVNNQMTQILNQGLDANGIPIWAQPAATAANQRMAALGLGASTMAGNAETAAILQAALPIAQQNASTYAAINQQNLANQQQTLLSNQAAQNAAAQFNAQSETQVSEFNAQTAASIAEQNAQQENAMTQFNIGQVNAMTQFDDAQYNAMAQFNAQNALLVDQSNVNWQRSVNTANTAAINAANNANAANMFNLQTSALNSEWQMLQDQASWALTASENSQNRGLTLATSAMNQQTSMEILNSQESASMFNQLGQFAVNAFGQPIASAINSIFPSSNNNTNNNNTNGDYGGGGDTGAGSGGGGPLTT